MRTDVRSQRGMGAACSVSISLFSMSIYLYPNLKLTLINRRSHLETSAPPQHAAPYFPGSAPPPQSYSSERHFCLMCRTDFTDKAEFLFHIRTHCDPHAQSSAGQPSSGKQGGGDAATAELIARGLVDPSGLCS